MTHPDPATAPPGGARLRYIPALDGLRGVSLPGTMLTHFYLALSLQPGRPGWLDSVAPPLTLNIQMFFVLSGTLITSLLVSEHRRAGAISLQRFYLRRTRRLGPALLAILPIMVVIQLAVSGSDSPLGPRPWLTVLSVAFFVGNWVSFHSAGGLGWVGPTWTLGIEEQYYLTWPALLRAALRRGAGRRGILAGLAIALVLALAVSNLLVSAVHAPYRPAYSSPVQLPSILAGCALGYELTVNPGGRLAAFCRSRLVGLAGLAIMVVVSVELWDSGTFLIRGGVLVYAAGACLLIGHCFVRAERPTMLTRLFGCKPFVVIGQVSYEAYLIHVVVILGVLRALPHMHAYPMMALDVSIVAVASGLFYYLVEQPIRRRGWRSVLLRQPAQSLGSMAAPAPAALHDHAGS